jgi:hypothetical protein
LKGKKNHQKKKFGKPNNATNDETCHVAKKKHHTRNKEHHARLPLLLPLLKRPHCKGEGGGGREEKVRREVEGQEKPLEKKLGKPNNVI